MARPKGCHGKGCVWLAVAVLKAGQLLLHVKVEVVSDFDTPDFDIPDFDDFDCVE